MAVFLIAVLVLLWTVASVHAACPQPIDGRWNSGDGHRYVLNGWSEVDGRCLATVRTHASKCDEVCKSNGGRWATVCSDAQHNWFAARGKAVDNNIWIGLTDNGVDGISRIYQWTNPGDAFTYSNWGPGEPKNDVTKKCVVMWRFAEPRGSYGWVTSSCTAGKIYCGCVTDVLAFPEPTAMQASAAISMEGLSVVDAALAPNCSTFAGWVSNQGKCYLATSPKKDYASCLSHCTGLGATMPCVMNALENDFLARLYPPAQTNDELVYLGYHQSEGTFQWQAGCSSPYTNFAPGEPKDWMDNEDCTVINTIGLNMWMWNDFNCSEVAHCVCERPSWPLPQDTISYSATANLQNAISTAAPSMLSSTSQVDYPAARTVCPAGWENNLGKCYLTTNPPPMNYAECENNCANLGATLPCVLNLEENGYLASNVHGALYLGLNKIATDGAYQWQTGCSSFYTYFWPVETNDFDGTGDCVVMNLNGLGMWNDASCWTVANCVCEKGATTARILAYTSTPVPVHTAAPVVVNPSHCSCADCAAAYSASQPLASHASSCSLYCYENC